MTSPKRWLLLGLSACALIVFAVAVILSRYRSVELPEGSMLRLAGVTYGTNAFVYGNLAEQSLAKWLPARGLSILGFTLRPPQKVQPFPPSPATGDPEITVWFGLRDRDPSRLRRLSGWAHHTQIFAMSKSGRCLENEPAKVYLTSSREVVFAATLTAFPRDRREIIVRVLRHDGSEWVKAGDFRAKNPVVVVPQKWKEQPIPTTNRIGPLQVSLKQARVWFSNGIDTPLPIASDVGLKITANGRLTDDWKIVGCVVRDTAGNYREGLL